MKSLRTILLLLGSLFVIYACGGGSSDSNAPADNGQAPSTNSGVFTGFTGDFLFSVIDPAAGVGSGADGQGGIGIGSNLGMIRNAMVSVYDFADGALIGQASTGSTGYVTARSGNDFKTGVIVEIRGTDSSDYYDVIENKYVPYPPDTVLRAIVPQVTGNIGVSMYTEAIVAALEASLPDQGSASGFYTRRNKELNRTRLSTIVIEQLDKHENLFDGHFTTAIAHAMAVSGPTTELPEDRFYASNFTRLHPGIPGPGTRNSQDINTLSRSALAFSIGAAMRDRLSPDEGSPALTYALEGADSFAADETLNGIGTDGKSYPLFAAANDHDTIVPRLAAAYDVVDNEIDQALGSLVAFPSSSMYYVSPTSTGEELRQMLHYTDRRLDSIVPTISGMPDPPLRLGEADSIFSDNLGRDVFTINFGTNPQVLALSTNSESYIKDQTPVNDAAGTPNYTFTPDRVSELPIVAAYKGGHVAMFRQSFNPSNAGLYVTGLDQGANTFLKDDFGGALGGPLFVDKDWSFASDGRVTDVAMNATTGDALFLSDKHIVNGTDGTRMTFTMLGDSATGAVFADGFESRDVSGWTSGLTVRNTRFISMHDAARNTNHWNGCTNNAQSNEALVWGDPQDTSGQEVILQVRQSLDTTYWTTFDRRLWQFRSYACGDHLVSTTGTETTAVGPTNIFNSASASWMLEEFPAIIPGVFVVQADLAKPDGHGQLFFFKGQVIRDQTEPACTAAPPVSVNGFVEQPAVPAFIRKGTTNIVNARQLRNENGSYVDVIILDDSIETANYFDALTKTHYTLASDSRNTISVNNADDAIVFADSSFHKISDENCTISLSGSK